MSALETGSLLADSLSNGLTIKGNSAVTETNVKLPKTPIERVNGSMFKDTDLGTLLIDVLSKVDGTQVINEVKIKAAVCAVYFHGQKDGVNYCGKLTRDGKFEVFGSNGSFNFYELRTDKVLTVFQGNILRMISEKKPVEWVQPSNLKEWLEFRSYFERLSIESLTSNERATKELNKLSKAERNREGVTRLSRSLAVASRAVKVQGKGLGYMVSERDAELKAERDRKAANAKIEAAKKAVAIEAKKAERAAKLLTAKEKKEADLAAKQSEKVRATVAKEEAKAEKKEAEKLAAKNSQPKKTKVATNDGVVTSYLTPTFG